MLAKILELNPWIEVFVRKLYWQHPAVHRLLSELKKKSGRKSAPIVVKPVALQKLFTTLRTLGVAEGDILIVHSSMRSLKALGLNPRQFNQALLDFLGPEGTLAMPAIPLFKDAPTGTARLTDAICSVPVAYDVQQTPPWTGALPLALMQMPTAVRSRHPLNSMVAKGRFAADMMQHNLDGDKPLGCGPQSSWKYCADRNAKIVALGVDLAHSLTMIHVAEDAYEDAWPIAGWYRNRLFDITDQGVTTRVTVRERHPKWAMYYAERTLAKDLKRDNVMTCGNVDGISIEFLESRALLVYLNARKSSGYPYFTRQPRKKA